MVQLDLGGVLAQFLYGSFEVDSLLGEFDSAFGDLREQVGCSYRTEELAAFADGGAVSEWALPSVAWAVEQSILHGDENGLLRPQAQATRAELAQVLKNFLACS